MKRYRSFFFVLLGLVAVFTFAITPVFGAQQGTPPADHEVHHDSTPTVTEPAATAGTASMPGQCQATPAAGMMPGQCDRTPATGPSDLAGRADRRGWAAPARLRLGGMGPVTIERNLTSAGMRDVRERVRSVVASVETGDPVLILQHGQPAAVVVRHAEAERWAAIERALSALHALDVYVELARDTAELASIVGGATRAGATAIRGLSDASAR